QISNIIEDNPLIQSSYEPTDNIPMPDRNDEPVNLIDSANTNFRNCNVLIQHYTGTNSFYYGTFLPNNTYKFNKASDTSIRFFITNLQSLTSTNNSWLHFTVYDQETNDPTISRNSNKELSQYVNFSNDNNSIELFFKDSIINSNKYLLNPNTYHSVVFSRKRRIGVVRDGWDNLGLPNTISTYYIMTTMQTTYDPFSNISLSNSSFNSFSNDSYDPILNKSSPYLYSISIELQGLAVLVDREF
ncbi:18429_t:CDS:2, partial [Gigaspora rosea]